MMSAKNDENVGGIDGASAGAFSVTRDEIEEMLRRASRAKSEASESTGELGALVKNFCEEHSIDKRALRFVLGLWSTEDSKRQSMIRSMIHLCNELGYFDQHDMFNDAATAASNIVDLPVKEKKPTAKKSAARQTDDAEGDPAAA